MRQNRRMFVLWVGLVIGGMFPGGNQGWRREVLAQTARQDSKMVFSITGGSTNVGGVLNLKVVLTDLNGKPLGSKKVVFGYDAGWNYGENIFTDADGVATYNLNLVNSLDRTGFVNNGKAKYQVNAYFQGDNTYFPVEGSIDFLVGSTTAIPSQTFTSFHKTNVVEPIPYSPWGKPIGDDGISVPHGALYYQTWKSANYGFIDNRSEIKLPDGRTIKKPIIYGMYFFDSGGDQSPNSLGSYEIPGSANCQWARIPKYCDASWQNAYLSKVREMGASLDGKVDGVMVSFGYDGEANFVKGDKGCSDYMNSSAFEQKYGHKCTESGFQSMLRKAVDVHLQSFPKTPVFVQGAPSGPADAEQKGYGYKLNSFTANSGEWGITMNAEYSTWMKYPRMRRAFESKIGGDGLYRSYWMILNMLNPKPDFIDFFQNHYPIFNKLPWFYNFVSSSLGKDSSNTDHVWSVLREVSEGARKDSESNPFKGQLSGYYGDFQYYLYRKETIPGNKTVAVRFDDPVLRDTYRNNSTNDSSFDQPYTNRSSGGPLPDVLNNYQPINNPPYTNYFTARKNASGNQYMSFDIDNGWSYAGLVPDGKLNYEVVLIYLDNGGDTLSLEYKDKSGQLKRVKIQKSNTRRWIRTSDSETAKIVLTDAYFADQLEGMTDIRINSNNDGEEIIHMLNIIGKGAGDLPAPTKTPGCSKKSVGDANCDEKVNIADFGIWKTEFISKTDGRADFDGDGKVSILDFGVWKVGFLAGRV